MGFPVTTSDIESRWRDLTSDESDVAFQLLKDADLKLRGLRPKILGFYSALPADVPPATGKADLLEAVTIAITAAVIRFLRNPDSQIRQEINSDGSVTVSFDTRYEGGVFIAADDLHEVDLAVAAANGVLYARVGSQQLISTFPWRPYGTYPLPTP